MAEHNHLVWETLPYEHHDKSPDWFWAVGIIALATAITAFALGNVLFALFILIGAGALGLHAARHPYPTHFALTERGLRVGITLYPYSTLHAFWLETRDDRPRLLVQSKKMFMPLIVFPLGGVDPALARNVLLRHIKETEIVEPLSQRVMELLGF